MTRYSGSAGDSAWAQVVEIKTRIRAAYRVAAWLDRHGAPGWAKCLRDDLNMTLEFFEPWSNRVTSRFGVASGRGQRGPRLVNEDYKKRQAYGFWQDRDWLVTIDFYSTRNRDLARGLKRLYLAGKASKGKDLRFFNGEGLFFPHSLRGG